MHAFAQHVPEFLRLYGNIVIFSQQGLEKLNDLTTKHYHRSTNHQGYEALNRCWKNGTVSNNLKMMVIKGQKEYNPVVFVNSLATKAFMPLQTPFN
jgi:hypothetical protein